MIVAYARVSTDKQDAENQRFEIERFLARDGRRYDEFVEETVSGKKDVDQRRIGDVLKSLKAGDTLIVSETSRISRKLETILNTISESIEREITIIAVKENYVFDSSINSKVIAFAFGLAAEIERNLISQRTKEALARKKAEGMTLGRPVGTSDPTKRKLHGKDDQILDYMEKRVPKAVIARLLDVHRGTLQTYINEHNLEFQLRVRRLKQTGV